MSTRSRSSATYSQPTNGVIAHGHGNIAESEFEPFPESALDGSIVDRFNATARRFPSRLAISDATRSFTYSELSFHVDHVAIAINAMIGERPGPVVIFCPNDVLHAATTLAILAAGRSYIPIDPKYPIERNQLIASHTGAAAVATIGNLIDQARSLVPGDVPIVDTARELERSPGAKLRCPKPQDLAHILYASGSTGPFARLLT